MTEKGHFAGTPAKNVPGTPGCLGFFSSEILCVFFYHVPCLLPIQMTSDLRFVILVARTILRDYVSDAPTLCAMGLLVSQHGQLGAIPPPLFLSVSPLESMRSGRAIPPEVPSAPKS